MHLLDNTMTEKERDKVLGRFGISGDIKTYPFWSLVLLHSRALRNVFRNMYTQTFTRAAGTNDKREFVLKWNFFRPVAKAILCDYETIYTGSGTDIEFPLMLGARKIMMIDPELMNRDIRSGLWDKFSSYVQEPTRENQFLWKGSFDFGSTPEVVTVRVIPGYTGHVHPDSEIPHITADADIGMFIGFVSGNSFDSEFCHRVVSGGAVIFDYASKIFHDEYAIVFSAHRMFRGNVLLRK